MSMRNHVVKRERMVETDAEILRSFKSLKKKDYPQYLFKLATYMSGISAHPHANTGWWCAHSMLMQELLPYLVTELAPETLESRDRFWEFVARQLSTCQKCSHHYHTALVDFELKGELSRKLTIRTIRALLKWDIARLLPKLTTFAHVLTGKNSEPMTDFRMRRGKDALLDALLRIRVCSDPTISNTISEIFVSATPLDLQEDLFPFTEQFGHIPSGLLVLCFHERHVVNSWARRVLQKALEKYKPETIAVEYVLGKVVVQLNSAARNEPAVASAFAPDEKVAWEGFETIFTNIKPKLRKVFTVNTGLTKLFKVMVSGLRHYDGTVVSQAAVCILYMLRGLGSQSLFASDALTPDDLLGDIISAFQRCHRQGTRRKLLDLIAPTISEARDVRNPHEVSNLFRKAFNFFNEIIMSGRPQSSSHSESFSKLEATKRNLLLDREAVLKTGASLLSWYYSHSAPALPLSDSSTISKFVLNILREDNHGEYGWSLLRCVLMTDVFNMIRLLRENSDARMIEKTYIAKRPGSDQLRREEASIVRKFAEAKEEEPKELLWAAPLWKALRTGKHVNKVLLAEEELVPEQEVRILLDLHGIIGMLDPVCVKMAVSRRKMSPESKSDIVPWREFQDKVGDAHLLSDRLGFIQTTITDRFLEACRSTGEQGWWKELPFHATHLLASAQKEVANRAFASLTKSKHILDASCAGSRSKLLANILKSDSADAEMMADGCVSAMRIISAVGCMNSVRTYPSFLLWYRVLLDSKYVGLLKSGNSNWALGVVVNFLRCWQCFEESTDRPVFTEVCCRLFSNLRDLWDRFLVLDPSSQQDNYLHLDGREAGLRTALKLLLDMHMLKDPIPRGAWVSTVCSLAESWKNVHSLREKVVILIEYHESNRGHLSLENCQKIAESGNVTELDITLQRWSRDDSPSKTFHRNAANRTLDRASPVDTLDRYAMPNQNDRKFPKESKNGKPRGLETTTIDQYFKPSQGESMIRAVVERKSSTTPFIGKRFATKNSLDIRSLRPPSKTRSTMRGPGHSSALDDLRRDLRTSRTGSRRVVRGGSSHVNPPTAQGEGGKTKFELLVEQQIAAKAAEKKARRLNGKAVDMDIDNVHKQTGALRLTSLPQKASTLATRPPRGDLNAQRELDEVTVVEHMFALPAHRRALKPRSTEGIYRQILLNKENISNCQSFPVGIDSNHDVYQGVEGYVAHWEPFVRKEFQSSLQNIITEESISWNRDSAMAGFKSWRTDFKVEGPLESVGYQQHLSIRFADEEKIGRVDLQTSKESDFSISKVQNSDLVLMIIPPLKFSDQTEPAGETLTALGLVLKVVRKGGEFSLKLNVAFDGASMAPGKGRQIQVVKLTNTTTFQRQLDALWGLSKVSDAVLWSILEPENGVLINKNVCEEQTKYSSDSVKPRMDFIERLHVKGVLNDSQRSAVTEVIRSCAPLFRSRNMLNCTTEHLDNHGSMSLIQGPPGTGKTSTILSLISALMMPTTAEGNAFQKVRVSTESGFAMMQVPKIRILVCAPSNAAVDELMVRAMEKGIPTPSGHACSPRMVRIGGGTTNETCKLLEVWGVAERSGGGHKTSGNDSSISKRIRSLQTELAAVNTKIGKADKERKISNVSYETEVTNDSKKKSASGRKTYGELTDQLTTLHSRKRDINQQLSERRDALKEDEVARKQERMKQVAVILNSCSVVFATLSSSGHDLLRNFGARFDVIIVDEAAQCGEPELLIPVTSSNAAKTGRIVASHVVLVGDPKQLPATVISTDKNVQRALGRSLFERISDNSRTLVHMLRTQYRMHPAVALFPSTHFYGGLLSNGENVRSKSMHRTFHGDRQLRFGPLSFLDTSKSNSKEVRKSGGSLYNSVEAKIVVAALESLVRIYRKDDFQNNIVVLSPYKQQVNLLRNLISDSKILRKLDIEVSTIDGIQGREKSVVFLSTVRSGHSRGIGFVDDNRRMNVAITRAQHSLVVVGHAIALSESSELWKSLIFSCRSRSLVFSLHQDPLRSFPEASRRFKVTSAPSLPDVSNLPEVDDSGCALSYPRDRMGNPQQQADNHVGQAIPLSTVVSMKTILANNASTIQKQDFQDVACKPFGLRSEPAIPYKDSMNLMSAQVAKPIKQLPSLRSKAVGPVEESAIFRANSEERTKHSPLLMSEAVVFPTTNGKEPVSSLKNILPKAIGPTVLSDCATLQQSHATIRESGKEESGGSAAIVRDGRQRYNIDNNLGPARASLEAANSGRQKSGSGSRNEPSDVIPSSSGKSQLYAKQDGIDRHGRRGAGPRQQLGNKKSREESSQRGSVLERLGQRPPRNDDALKDVLASVSAVDTSTAIKRAKTRSLSQSASGVGDPRNKQNWKKRGAPSSLGELHRPVKARRKTPPPFERGSAKDRTPFMPSQAYPPSRDAILAGRPGTNFDEPRPLPSASRDRSRNKELVNRSQARKPVGMTSTGHVRTMNTKEMPERAEANARLLAMHNRKKRGDSAGNRSEKEPKKERRAVGRHSRGKTNPQQRQNPTFSLARSQKQMQETHDMMRRLP